MVLTLRQSTSDSSHSRRPNDADDQGRTTEASVDLPGRGVELTIRFAKAKFKRGYNVKFEGRTVRFMIGVDSGFDFGIANLRPFADCIVVCLGFFWFSFRRTSIYRIGL